MVRSNRRLSSGTEVKTGWAKRARCRSPQRHASMSSPSRSDKSSSARSRLALSWSSQFSFAGVPRSSHQAWSCVSTRCSRSASRAEERVEVLSELVGEHHLCKRDQPGVEDQGLRRARGASGSPSRARDRAPCPGAPSLAQSRSSTGPARGRRRRRGCLARPATPPPCLRSRAPALLRWLGRDRGLPIRAAIRWG